MSRGDVAAWIDARARLRGRLATLVALREGDACVERAFMPLLVAENVACLPSWRPTGLVRRSVPRNSAFSTRKPRVSARPSTSISWLLAMALTAHLNAVAPQ